MTVTFCGDVYFTDDDFLEFVKSAELDDNMNRILDVADNLIVVLTKKDL
jgi:hypothetical protein